jgi:hypothetical protein
MAQTSALHGNTHTVEFYDDSAVFLDSLGDLLADTLRRGGVCLIVATDAHRQGLAQRLRNAGIDLTLAVRNHQYLLLDAKATLDRFMVDGWPDRDLFFATLDPLLQQAEPQPDAPLPVAFGEMVALLWAEGRFDAAVHLEQLWNELLQRRHFLLHCAYPRSGFAATPAHQAMLERICREHTHVGSPRASR